MALVALPLTALLVHAGLAAWWLLPLVVIGILGASLWGVARTA